MTTLLDANVLIALLIEDHVHHERAERWLEGIDGFATCPVTQGALVRFLIRSGATSAEALAVLVGVAADARHDFWPADVSYTEVDQAGVAGHRQVTDAYLAELARVQGAKLATLDRALAALRGDVAELLPS